MSSFLTFTTNVSLISITVDPGTFIACVVVFFFFVSLYVPWTPLLRLPQRISLPSLPYIKQQQTQEQQEQTQASWKSSPTSQQVYSSSPRRFVLRDISLLKNSSKKSSRRQLQLPEPESSYNYSRSTYYNQQDDGVDARALRRPQRFFEGFRKSDGSQQRESRAERSKHPERLLLPAPPAQQRAGDGSRPLRGRPGFGLRLRRWWLLSAGVEETRQRRSQ